MCIHEINLEFVEEWFVGDFWRFFRPSMEAYGGTHIWDTSLVDVFYLINFDHMMIISGCKDMKSFWIEIAYASCDGRGKLQL